MTQFHNSGINTIPRNPGELVPGFQGMQVKNPGAPAGVANFGAFTESGTRQATPAPMERPVMKALIQKVRVWLSRYMMSVRGTPLREDEDTPKLLILMYAMYQTPEPERSRAMDCLREQLIPISTSLPVTVHWNHQPFQSVPWKVREFPVSVATLILEQCRNRKLSAEDEILDVRTDKRHGRTLAPHERPQAAFKPFRKPTAAEAQQDAGLDVTPIPTSLVNMSGEGTGGGLLFAINPGEGPADIAGPQPARTRQVGSANMAEDSAPSFD